MIPAPSPIPDLPDGLTWEPARRKFCVEVRVRPYPKKRKRFAATTPLGVMLAWRHTTINELTDARRVLERAAQANADPLAPTAAPAPLGTFRADVELYITTKMPAALKATQPQWIRYLRTAARGELGRLPRQLITGRHWGDLLATWIRDGIPAELGDGNRRRIVKPKPISVATARKVRTAWITFYKTMDEGLNLPNPAKLCKRPADAPGAAPLPGGIPLADALAIVAQLPKGSRTGARIALMVLLGLRPCEIMRIDAAKDWNRRAKTLYVRTAKFGRPRTLPLEPAATAALQLLDTHPSGKGWGTFTSAPAARMFHAAVAKAGMGHYEPLVPYAMRHTFATNAYALSGDLKAVSEAIGHKSLKMTERYVEAAVSAQVAGLFGTIRKAKPKATKPKATTPKAGRGLRLVAGA
jgi:integrase